MSKKQEEEKALEGFNVVQRLVEGAIRALAKAIEMRDPYTASHQRRVTKLANIIAKKMDLTQGQISTVRVAATIHDIGKIYVPAEILAMPRKLNSMEMDIIKQHPKVGYDILKTEEFPWPIAKIVLQHHERLNGSGYPSGCSGKDIALEARIVAVADVVEAMSSHRPYRAALGVDKALREILEHRGVLYDKKVVDVCAKVLFRCKKCKTKKDLLLMFRPAPIKKS